MAEFKFRKVAVIGAGPVGCVAAAHFAKGGYEVTICDVVEELAKATTDPGIRVEGAIEINHPVTKYVTSVDDLALDPPEVIFVAVKVTVLPLIGSAIQSFHKPGMAVVSWQNGVDTERVLAESIGPGCIIRGVVNMGCNLAAPGHVKTGFHHPPHYVQELAPESRAAAEAIAAALTEVGLPTERTDELNDMVWRKSILNAAMSAVCAVTGMTMSKAYRDPLLHGTIDTLLKEGIQVARANEIHLGWDFYNYAHHYLGNAGDHKPSMLVDVEKKRRTEIDFLNGKIVEYGERVGIPTPSHGTIRSLVKARELN
jgi:2-dehydropantoate 2-reductase